MREVFTRFSLKDTSNRKSYYAAYTFLFGIAAFFCFSWFIFSGKSLIWQDDGWTQHFKALVYYAQYLRRIIRHLIFEHKIIIPDWDFYIGEGSDIVNAFHYYVMGDPIALLSVFVPTRYLHYFYSFSCILRLYLAGIAFSFLCFETGLKNRYGILAGSIAYCFCSWSLLNAARHPYFLNPMIYLPLMIIGIEKIIRKEKPYLFIVASAISAVSNFYFFYMIVIMSVLYAVFRLGFLYRKAFHKTIATLLHLGIMAVIGVCIAGIILLPVLMMFLQDSRLSVPQPLHLFYSMEYYSELPSIFISDKYVNWLCLGYVAPAVMAVFLLFMKRGDRLLKVLFAVMVLIMIFPIGGRLLNGMSYATNRWSWALAILCMYILAKKWEDLLSLSSRQWTLLTILAFAYYMICLFFEKSRSASAFSAIVLFFVVLIITRQGIPKKNGQTAQQVLLVGLVVFGVINTAFWMFSPGTGDYLAEFKENRKIWDEWVNNEAVAVKSVSDSSYTRFSGRSLTTNANILNGVSSTQYYWTISNPYMNNYRSALCMREPMYFNFQGYDDRTTPLALSAVQYYSTDNEKTKGMPYGYTFAKKINADKTRKRRIEELKEELGVDKLSDEQQEVIDAATANNYFIYKNDYSLPITYSYDAYLPKEKWESYNPVQKQEVQLDAAYVDSDPEEIKAADIQMPDYLIDYDIECKGKNVTRDGNRFITTSKDAKIVLTLHQKKSDSETYVGFSGLEFKPTAEYELYFGDETVDPLNLYNKTNWDMLSRNKQVSVKKEKFFWNSIKNASITIASSSGVKKKIDYKQPESTFSSGRHDYIANLGYQEDPVTKITITFPTRGIYSFSSLDVYGIPLKDFESKIEKLQKDSLQNVVFETDTVSGNISLEDDKLLCLAIPFSIGWEASIDGAETEVYCLNERYLGIEIPKGDHSIRFYYHMPYKKAGFFVTILGFAGFGIVVIYDQRARRKGVAA